MLDENRWNKLVERLSGNLPPDGAFSRILACYSESHRYYHTVVHLKHCLLEFDEVKKFFEAPDEVEFALWLHDVVYDTHATDNEEKSAQIGTEILLESRCPKMRIEKITDLILYTRHGQPPASYDGQLIVDIDLAILGQEPEIFQVYEKNIRAEYFWVPAESYKIGRTKVLERFLDRPSIYMTDTFKKLYEQQARENIMQALRALL